MHICSLFAWLRTPVCNYEHFQKLVECANACKICNALMHYPGEQRQVPNQLNKLQTCIAKLHCLPMSKFFDAHLQPVCLTRYQSMQFLAFSKTCRLWKCIVKCILHGIFMPYRHFKMLHIAKSGIKSIKLTTDHHSKIALLNQTCERGFTTFSITTFSVTSLSIQGLYTTLSINDTQHNWTFCITRFCIMLSVIMLNVTFYLLLCWVSLCWTSLCWVS